MGGDATFFPDRSMPSLFDEHLARGNEALDRRDYHEADEAFEAALAAAGAPHERALALDSLDRGVALIMLDRDEEALVAFDASLDLLLDQVSGDGSEGAAPALP